MQRGGGRAESFLIVGAGLGIVSNVVNALMVGIRTWLFSIGQNIPVVTNYQMFLNIVSMAGILCLIYAFWVKFKECNIKEEVSN